MNRWSYSDFRGTDWERDTGIAEEWNATEEGLCIRLLDAERGEELTVEGLVGYYAFHCVRSKNKNLYHYEEGISHHGEADVSWELYATMFAELPERIREKMVSSWELKDRRATRRKQGSIV